MCQEESSPSLGKPECGEGSRAAAVGYNVQSVINTEEHLHLPWKGLGDLQNVP